MSESKLLSKIAVHGVPRSGTSWLGEIFNSSQHTIYKFQPLFSYAFKDYLSPCSTSVEIEDFFNLLAKTSDDFIDQTEKRSNGVLPIFEKKPPTHIVYKEVRYHNILSNMLKNSEDLTLVAIVRNPVDVINSWLNAPLEFRPERGWDPDTEWRYANNKNLGRPEEFNGFEKWKFATKIFMELLDKYPTRVFIVNYEDLVSDTMNKVYELFGFVGLQVSGQVERFISESKQLSNSDAYSVFRGNANHDSRKYSLTKENIEAIYREIYGSRLERFLR